MNAQKQKTIDNNKNISDNSSISKTKEECPKEKKDCDNCELLHCPEEKI